MYSHVGKAPPSKTVILRVCARARREREGREEGREKVPENPMIPTASRKREASSEVRAHAYRLSIYNRARMSALLVRSG